MLQKTQNAVAFGKPGIEPRWTRGNKDAVGTAYSASSRVWFTLAAGILNEVYFPTIDHPQIRDLQYLITDGETFFHDERRHLQSTTTELAGHALGYQITNTDPAGLYQIVKQVITDPHHPCVLVHTRLEAEQSFLKKIRLFALLAPHLGAGGWGNSGRVYRVGEREILLAQKGDLWLGVPFSEHRERYIEQWNRPGYLVELNPMPIRLAIDPKVLMKAAVGVLRAG